MRVRKGFLFLSFLLAVGACQQAPKPAGKIPITTSSNEARAAFEKAQVLIEKLRGVEALPLLDEAIAKDPRFAMAYLLKAQSSGTPKEYFEHLKKAVELSGAVSDGERLWIQSVEAGSGGKTNERGELLAKLAAAYPSDEQSHFLLGVHYYNLQQPDQAIAEYQKALQLNPGLVRCYNMLGYAYQSTEKYKDAEQAFRKYLELIPDEPNPYDSLGELLMKTGRFDESSQNYQKALEKNGRFLTAYRGLALNLMYQERYAEAKVQAEKYLTLAQTEGEKQQARLTLTVIDADSGNWAGALKTLDEASAEAEKRGDKAFVSRAAYLQGDILLLAGKLEEARGKFDKSLASARQSNATEAVKHNLELAYRGRLAVIAAEKRDFKTALKEAEVMRAGFEPVGNLNQMRGVHEVLGQVALREKAYDRAIEQLTQANLKSPLVLFRLGEAYAGKRDSGKAAEYFGQAARSYTLPDIQYAMIRKQAKKAAGAS